MRRVSRARAVMDSKGHSCMCKHGPGGTHPWGLGSISGGWGAPLETGMAGSTIKRTCVCSFVSQHMMQNSQKW